MFRLIYCLSASAARNALNYPAVYPLTLRTHLSIAISALGAETTRTTGTLSVWHVDLDSDNGSP